MRKRGNTFFVNKLCPLECNYEKRAIYSLKQQAVLALLGTSIDVLVHTTDTNIDQIGIEEVKISQS